MSQNKREIIHKILSELLFDEGIPMFETMIVDTIVAFVESYITSYLTDDNLRGETSTKPTLKELVKFARAYNKIPLPKPKLESDTF